MGHSEKTRLAVKGRVWGFEAASVARGESRRYETDMVYLSPSFSPPKKKPEPTQSNSIVSHPHRNKHHAFTNLIGDDQVVLNWLRLICAALPAGRVTVLLV